MVAKTRNKSSHKEKRQHPRFRVYNIIRVIGPSGREIQSDSALVNISEGGLLFYSTEEVDKNSRVQIHMDIPEFNSSLSVFGKVRWAQKAVDRAESHFVGIQFMDIHETDKDLISRLGKSEK